MEGYKSIVRIRLDSPSTSPAGGCVGISNDMWREEVTDDDCCPETLPAADGGIHSSASDPMEIFRSWKQFISDTDPAKVVPPKLATLLTRFISGSATAATDALVEGGALVTSGSSEGGGTAKTATIFKCSRFKLGFAASAVPITFLSAHNDPVGMLTSIFVPEKGEEEL